MLKIRNGASLPDKIQELVALFRIHIKLVPDVGDGFYQFFRGRVPQQAGRRIIRLRGPGKTGDQPGFKGRQQVLIDLPAFGSADQFQGFQVKDCRYRPPGLRVAWFQRKNPGAGQAATPPHYRSPPGIRWQPAPRSIVFPQGSSGSAPSRRVP